MFQPLAIITGATGQDGAYLSEWLLGKGYRVVGVCRVDSSPDTSRLKILGIDQQVEFRPVALHDYQAVRALIQELQPAEIYHLAAQSSVARSFEDPLGCCQTDGLITLHLLEAIRTVSSRSRLFNACSAEIFGDSGQDPLSEATPISPLSPYACAKAYGYSLASVYRKSYGLAVCSGILFNHESPLRGSKFVTQKIVAGLARLAHSPGPPLELGNLEAVRDWGYAPEYVQGMWKMLQLERSEDFVLATGECLSVKGFAELVGQACGLDFRWTVEGEREVAREQQTGRILMQVDASLRRANDIARSRGDASKARSLLDWSAQTRLPELAKILVAHEMGRLKLEAS